jgi:hypothetical protein
MAVLYITDNGFGQATAIEVIDLGAWTFILDHPSESIWMVPGTWEI